MILPCSFNWYILKKNSWLVNRACYKSYIDGFSSQKSWKTINHSARRRHYKSSSFNEVLKNIRIVQSNSSIGNCYDNTITASFFHTLKTELTYWAKYQTRDEAKRCIFEYMEIHYNRRRLHSTLGYLSLV